MGVRRRRKPRSANGEVIANPFDCRCSDKFQLAVVAGTGHGASTSSKGKVRASLVSSVVAALKHVSAPVCTWDETDLDEVQVEGIKLSRSAGESWQESAGRRKKFCMLLQQQRVFGRMWSVSIGPPQVRYFDMGQESELYQDLQETLLRDGMCLLDIQGSSVAVIHHQDYFVVVDCGARNESGLPCRYGKPVAVFNTCLNDLMLHIMALKKSLGAQWYAMLSISVKTDDVTVDTDNAQVCGDSDVNISVAADVIEDCTFVSPDSHASSVRGTFHQGDKRFKYGGQQCMAISLVGLATHSVESVFSWRSDNLDKVVQLGDELYTSLRDGKMIRGAFDLLSVPDLPTQLVVDGHHLEFVYGDFVSGNVDVVAGEFIASGAYTSLKCGLEKMCKKYDTCFLTLGGSTCAIIGQDGRYAVVDSHARSADGMVDANGQSVVVYFACLGDVFDHISQISKAITKGLKLFEIAGVCVSSKGSTEEVCISSGSTLNQNKRKTATGLRSESKQVKISDVDADVNVVDSDVVFVTDVTSRTLQFNPLCTDVAQGLCRKLHVESEKVDVVSSQVGELGVPCKNDTIVADGNCFFRAVSQAVCGTQKHHKKIRSSVFKQLQQHVGAYDSVMRSEYTSMSEYLSISRMKYVGSWATEIEIQAAADCLGVNIFTYIEGRWLEYSCRDNVFSNQGIYLENCNGNHFETVVCAQQPHGQSCYNYCKLNMSCHTGYNLRQHGKDKDVCSDAEHLITGSPPSPVVVNAVDTEDVIEPQTHSTLSTSDNIGLKFKPLSLKVARTLCNKCDIDFEKQDVQGPKVSGYLGAVCQTESIVKDGNSLFRAVTQVISGSQKRHLKVRGVVVRHMEKDGGELMKLVHKQYKSMSDYISKSQMKYVGHNATNVEIQATANAFGVDIYSYSGDSWQTFKCNIKLSDEGIYLKQCDDNHFEQVVCVQNKDQLVCCGLCKVETKYMCTRQLKLETDSTLNVSVNVNYCFSKYLKRKKNFKNKVTCQFI